MFFTLAKIGWFLAQPLTAIALLGAAGLLARLLGRGRIGAGLMVAAAAFYAAAAYSPAGVVLQQALEERFPRPEPPETVAGIVVLGGMFDTRVGRTRGLPELNEAADRFTAALVLARLYPDARMIFSGGVAAAFAEDIPETGLARDLAAALGLPPARLELDAGARDTYENAVNTFAMADPAPGETWLLVTSAGHMPRAMGTFRTVGFDVVPYPVDYRTGAAEGFPEASSTTVRNLEKLHFALREALGLLAYRLAGRTPALVPGP